MHPNDPNYHDPHENCTRCEQCDELLFDDVTGYVFEEDKAETPDGRWMCAVCARDVHGDAKWTYWERLLDLETHTYLRGLQEAMDGAAYAERWADVGTLYRMALTAADEAERQTARAWAVLGKPRWAQPRRAA